MFVINLHDTNNLSNILFCLYVGDQLENDSVYIKTCNGLNLWFLIYAADLFGFKFCPSLRYYMCTISSTSPPEFAEPIFAAEPIASRSNSINIFILGPRFLWKKVGVSEGERQGKTWDWNS